MTVQDNWLANLRALVDALSEGDDKRAGYRAVASATSLSEEYIYQLYEGKPKADGSPRAVGPRAAKAIARAFAEGRPHDWFDRPPGEPAMSNQTKKPVEIPLESNPDYPAIRRVKLKLSAGCSGFAVDYIEDEAAPIVFRKDWFERRGFKPERLLAVQVANGSMEPNLYHGDTVVINLDDTAPRDGTVFAVNYHGEMVIKRLILDEGRWWLYSDNPDQRRYPRRACTDDVYLLGRIVHKQSEQI